MTGAASLISHAAVAQSLFSDNFDAAQPGSAYTASIPGSGFQVSSGDVDIIGNIQNGAASGFFACPGASGLSNNCLDLNGNQPGAITTTSGYNLQAGTTYQLNFDLAGSLPVTSAYTVQASIGNSAPFTFSIPAGRGFGTETVLYTPTTNQTAAHVSFSSLTNVPENSQYGALLDNVSLATTTPTAAAAALGSQLIFQQDLSSAVPGPNYTGAVPNTGFTVTSGNVDVFGNPTGTGGFYTCPSPRPSTAACIDLNGDEPGTIQSDQIWNLTAGSTYTVSFDLAGNIPNGDLSAYTMTAAFGDSGAYSFSVAPDSAFQTETFSYTPTEDETAARLVLASEQTLDSLLYGPIITDISIVEPTSAGLGSDTAELPEPASLTFVVPGLLGVVLTSRTRRLRHSAGAA